MKVKFNFNDKTITLKMKQVNIIAGGSKTGKTELLNTIAGVFQGTEEAYVDNQTITKGYYQVKIVSPTQTIDDELKFTSKTEFYIKTKELISEIDKDEIKEIFESINNSLNPIEELLRKEFSLSESKFEFNDMLSFIKTHFTFINTDDHSTSSKRYLLINDVIINSIRESKTILLIDDFDAFFDIEQMVTIIENIEKNQNIILIVFVKSPSLCRLYFERYPIFIINNSLRELKDIIREYSKRNIDYHKSQLSFVLITEEESTSNYTNIVRVYFNELFYILTIENKEKVIGFFEKNKLFDKRDLEIIENFKKYTYQINDKSSI